MRARLPNPESQIPAVLMLLLLACGAATPAAAQPLSIDAGPWLHAALRARLEADIRQSDAPEGDRSATQEEWLHVGRRRIGVEGRAIRVLEYQVEYELAARRWRDVYVGYRQFDAFRLRVGLFKVPFGLEENTSTTNLDFVYRARISSRLAPGRDRGLMAHGRVLSNRIEYETGFFRHDGENARPSTAPRVYGGRTVAGRVVLQPFRGSTSVASKLRIGAASAISNVPTGFPGIRARTVFGSSFYDSDVWVSGRRFRTGLEARWRSGPMSIQAEYMRATDERRGQSVEDQDLSPLVAHGWYLAATYAVVRQRRLGTIDLAARIERLAFGSSGSGGEPSSSARADRVRGNADRVMTLGLNWKVNRWIRVQGNLIREQIAEPSLGPSPERAAFWSRALRVQVAM